MMATFAGTVIFLALAIVLLFCAWVAAAGDRGTDARPFAIAAAICLGFAAWGIADLARAQSGHRGDDHAQGHDLYKNWTPPNNPKTSCCNDSDCRPTRAYMHDDGLWRAWNGYLWLTVPRDRVLPTDYAGDGRSHLCERGTWIYCFSPGEPRG